jgi:hypothetical protein
MIKSIVFVKKKKKKKKRTWAGVCVLNHILRIEMDPTFYKENLDSYIPFGLQNRLRVRT